MLSLEDTSGDHLVQLLCSRQGVLEPVANVFSHVLNISKDGDSKKCVPLFNHLLVKK